MLNKGRAETSAEALTTVSSTSLDDNKGMMGTNGCFHSRDSYDSISHPLKILELSRLNVNGA